MSIQRKENYMKKLLFLAALLPALSATSALAADIPIRLNQSGSLLDRSAISESGQIYLPLHDIAYATGERIRYDSEKDIAYIPNSACFYINSPDSSVAYEQYRAKKFDGEFYITPESYVKIFGGSVAWDKENNIIDITEKDYRFGLDEIQLFRPAETVVKTDSDGNVYLEVCEQYSETMPISPDVTEYTKDVEEGRIPIVSLLKTYYGIDYSITQAFKKRPTATIKLTRGNKTYIYTIHFKECSD